MSCSRNAALPVLEMLGDVVAAAGVTAWQVRAAVQI